MNPRSSILAAALCLAALGACDDGAANPSRLYLALLDSELTVQLVDSEPPPF